MIGFYMKKSFFDGWDNLIAIVVLNIGFVGMLALGYAAFALFQVQVALAFLVLIIWFVLLHLFVGGVSFYTKEFAWYQRPGIADFWDSVKAAMKSSLVLAAVNAFLIVLVMIVIPFYAAMNSLVGIILVAVLFWTCLIAVMSMMYFLPISVQLGDGPKKALKKSFLLFLDNTGFSFFLFFYTIFNVILSIITALLMPGATAILMSHQIACKLIMYKYDYLEENPEADRKKIPWGALLFEEREKVGYRTLKGMIFPWKE